MNTEKIMMKFTPVQLLLLLVAILVFAVVMIPVGLWITGYASLWLAGQFTGTVMAYPFWHTALIGLVIGWVFGMPVTSYRVGKMWEKMKAE